tara:strand:+ start:45282 stop:45476 length:195 start_codon:yes stop_codon:yes gene_type:complete
MIKDLFVLFCKTIGIVTSTAKDSFIEGYNNPYVPVTEEDVKDAEEFVHGVNTAWNEDADLDAAR